MNTIGSTSCAHTVEVMNEKAVPQLRWLVKRYSIIVSVFSHSLTDEFWPSDDTIIDWTDNFALLREASFPLADFLHKNRSSLREHHHEDAQRFVSVKRLISNGIRILVDKTSPELNSNERSCAEILTSANFELRQASAVLDNWLTLLGSSDEAVLPWDLSPSRDVVKGLLVEHEERLDRALRKLQSDDAIFDQCMASRKLFLIAHYATFLYPDIWTRERFDKLLKIQKSLITKMSDGSPHRLSVIKRWRQIDRSELLRDFTWSR